MLLAIIDDFSLSFSFLQVALYLTVLCINAGIHISNADLFVLIIHIPEFFCSIIELSWI
jgi:hypothetical protein